MKKVYITFGILLILGISAGVFYLQVVRPGTAELPEDVVMETAFGEEFTFAEMPKKARLIEFMYTNCSDVCPTTTIEMSKLRKQLEKEMVLEEEVEFNTITKNPRDDKQEILKDYPG